MLINEIVEEKIEMLLVMAPYHPVVYDKLEKEYPLVAASGKLTRQIATDIGAKVTGSFDPHMLGLEKGVFYDSMHCNKATIESILK